MRVRLADKFGCPISEVGQRVPAWELPYWREHFAREPWGFRAMDHIASKTAMQICAAVTRLKPGTTVHDFMFKSRFESGELTQEEFDALSAEEQSQYVERQVSRARMVLN